MNKENNIKPTTSFLTGLDDASIIYPNRLSRICQICEPVVSSTEFVRSDSELIYWIASHEANLQGRVGPDAFARSHLHDIVFVGVHVQASRGFLDLP